MPKIPIEELRKINLLVHRGGAVAIDQLSMGDEAFTSLAVEVLLDIYTLASYEILADVLYVWDNESYQELLREAEALDAG